jgi:hypothetical protein
VEEQVGRVKSVLAELLCAIAMALCDEQFSKLVKGWNRGELKHRDETTLTATYGVGFLNTVFRLIQDERNLAVPATAAIELILVSNLAYDGAAGAKLKQRLFPLSLRLPLVP